MTSWEAKGWLDISMRPWGSIGLSGPSSGFAAVSLQESSTLNPPMFDSVRSSPTLTVIFGKSSGQI